MCQSYDWPQFEQPLDTATAQLLKVHVRSFANFEKKIQTYLSIRKVTLPLDALRHRLQILQHFPIQKGITFRDFFGAVFPKINQGLDQLDDIVSRMLKRRAGFGSALFYGAGYIKKNSLPQKTTIELQTWLDQYVD